MDWSQPSFSNLPLGMGRVEDLGMKEPGKGTAGGSCCNFLLCFSPSNSILIGNKLIFPELSVFCPWWYLVRYLTVFVLTHELFHLTFSLYPVEERDQESGWVGGLMLATSNPPQWAKSCSRKELILFSLPESPKAVHGLILCSSREEGQKGLNISVSTIFHCIYEGHDGEDLLHYYKGWGFPLLHALKTYALFPVSYKILLHTLYVYFCLSTCK